MAIIPENLAIKKPDKKLLKKMNDVDLKEKIIFQKQSDFHSIQIVENKIGRFLKYDETYQAGYIKTEFYSGNLPYINYFLIPFLMNQDIENILLVGFGSGILINQYEKLFKKVKKIDVVDIEENIFPLAEKYFDFKNSDNVDFCLQDALVFLKETKKKYDLIVVDVAGDEGIDERFCTIEYLESIKKKLKKNGIFVSNMPSSRDIFNSKNQFPLSLIEKHKKVFKNLKLYNGETSNKIFYKTFFDIDEIVLDITNLIFISSDRNWEISLDVSEINKLSILLDSFLEDLIYND